MIDKPTFVFVLGVEGAGHSLLRGMLQPLLSRPDASDEDRWHKSLIDWWNPYPLGRLGRHLQKDKVMADDDRLKERFVAQIRQSITSGIRLFFETASFPYGRHHQPRSGLRRPDVPAFVALVSDLVNLKLVFIRRDPAACLESALRREFTKSSVLQARIIEDNLLYLSKMADRFSNALFLDYERICEDPQASAEKLCAYVGVPPSSADPNTVDRTKSINSARSEFRAYFDDRRWMWARLDEA